MNLTNNNFFDIFNPYIPSKRDLRRSEILANKNLNRVAICNAIFLPLSLIYLNRIVNFIKISIFFIFLIIPLIRIIVYRLMNGDPFAEEISSSLGGILLVVLNLSEQIYCVREARKRIERESGANYLELDNNLHNSGELYKDQKRYSEAEPILIQEIEFNRKTLGENHPSVANSINQLAELYYIQKR